ncbi:hypothetical protein ACPXCO_24060 [Streptomyces cyaneofuscatus]|uniref:hypothetical protein n=1 Tax=Streptomyces cyaneofuscatus TaxID=66883 RepID=UPI003CF25081
MNTQRRATAAFGIALSAAAMLSLAACSSDASNNPGRAMKTPPAPQEKASKAPAASPDTQATTLPSDEEPIARTQGDKGIVGEVYRVQRKDGVLTIWAGAKNTGSENYLPVSWRNGTDVYTLAGSSAVDKKNSKRYMALLDSSGQCLCSERLGGSIEPGATLPLYVQFQDPPQNVNEVDLQLGNMQVVSISLPAS